jgi:FAD/FMN-containing dehydrogenase
MVMRPSTTKDVQSGLQCATAQNLSVAVRNGGHSYAGYSQNPGAVVMNVRALNSIQLVNYTIQPLGQVVPALRLGGGVIFGEILNFLNGSCGGACTDTE